MTLSLSIQPPYVQDCLCPWLNRHRQHPDSGSASVNTTYDLDSDPLQDVGSIQIELLHNGNMDDRLAPKPTYCTVLNEYKCVQITNARVSVSLISSLQQYSRTACVVVTWFICSLANCM